MLYQKQKTIYQTQYNLINWNKWSTKYDVTAAHKVRRKAPNKLCFICCTKSTSGN